MNPCASELMRASLAATVWLETNLWFKCVYLPQTEAEGLDQWWNACLIGKKACFGFYHQTSWENKQNQTTKTQK